jgi:hypothetical protein
MPLLRSLVSRAITPSFKNAILPNLQYLNLDGLGRNVQIDIDDIPTQIRHLGLHGYDLRQRNKTSISPRLFPDLEVLVLVDVLISDFMPECIVAPSLTRLSLIDGAKEYCRNTSRHLETLWINGPPFGSTLLQELQLEGIRFNSHFIQYLQELLNLRELNIIDCKIPKEIFAPICASFPPSLIMLRVHSLTRECDGFNSPEFLQKLGEFRPSLKLELNIF